MSARRLQQGSFIVVVASVVLLISSLLAGVALVQQNQNINKKAACPGGFDQCRLTRGRQVCNCDCNDICTRPDSPSVTQAPSTQVENSQSTCDAAQGYAWCGGCGGFCIRMAGTTCTQEAASRCNEPQRVSNPVCNADSSGAIVVNGASGNNYFVQCNGTRWVGIGARDCTSCLADVADLNVPAYLRTEYDRAVAAELELVQQDLTAPLPLPPQEPTSNQLSEDEVEFSNGKPPLTPSLTLNQTPTNTRSGVTLNETVGSTSSRNAFVNPETQFVRDQVSASQIRTPVSITTSLGGSGIQTGSFRNWAPGTACSISEPNCPNFAIPGVGTRLINTPSLIESRLDETVTAARDLFIPSNPRTITGFSEGVSAGVRLVNNSGSNLSSAIGRVQEAPRSGAGIEPTVSGQGTTSRNPNLGQEVTRAPITIRHEGPGQQVPSRPDTGTAVSQLLGESFGIASGVNIREPSPPTTSNPILSGIINFFDGYINTSQTLSNDSNGEGTRDPHRPVDDSARAISVNVPDSSGHVRVPSDTLTAITATRVTNDPVRSPADLLSNRGSAGIIPNDSLSLTQQAANWLDGLTPQAETTFVRVADNILTGAGNVLTPFASGFTGIVGLGFDFANNLDLPDTIADLLTPDRPSIGRSTTTPDFNDARVADNNTREESGFGNIVGDNLTRENRISLLQNPNISTTGADLTLDTIPDQYELSVFLTDTVNQFQLLSETNPERILQIIRESGLLELYPYVNLSVYGGSGLTTEDQENTFALFIMATARANNVVLDRGTTDFIGPDSVFASWYGGEDDNRSGQFQITQCVLWQNLMDRIFPELNIADVSALQIYNASEVFDFINPNVYSEVEGGRLYPTREGSIQFYQFDDISRVQRGDTCVYGDHMCTILDRYEENGQLYFLISEANSPNGLLDGTPQTYVVDEAGFMNLIRLDGVLFLRSNDAAADPSLQRPDRVPSTFTELTQERPAQTVAADSLSQSSIANAAISRMQSCVPGQGGYYNACEGEYYNGQILQSTEGVRITRWEGNHSIYELYWCTQLVYDAAEAAGLEFRDEEYSAFELHEDMERSQAVIENNHRNLNDETIVDTVAFVSRDVNGTDTVVHVGIVSEVVTTEDTTYVTIVQANSPNVTATYELGEDGRLMYTSSDGTEFFIDSFGDLETYANNEP